MQKTRSATRKASLCANGQPYIIYCDIYSFQRKRTSINVWAMDGRVVKTSPPYPLFIDQAIAPFLDMMADQKFTLKDKLNAAYQIPI